MFSTVSTDSNNVRHVTLTHLEAEASNLHGRAANHGHVSCILSTSVTLSLGLFGIEKIGNFFAPYADQICNIALSAKDVGGLVAGGLLLPAAFCAYKSTSLYIKSTKANKLVNKTKENNPNISPYDLVQIPAPQRHGLLPRIFSPDLSKR